MSADGGVVVGSAYNSANQSRAFRWVGSSDCPCTPADIASTDGTPGPDGLIDAGDFSAFFSAFFTANYEDCGAPWATQCTPADIATSDGTPAPSRPGDGCLNNGDFQLFFASFFTGCP